MWDKVMAVNLTAPAMVTKRGVASMIKTNTKGSIINIASIAGIVGFTSGKPQPATACDGVVTVFSTS